MSKCESRQPYLGHEDQALRDDELEAVTGAKGASWLEALAKALGELENKQAQNMQQRAKL
jgi:hypothetical protein